MYHMSLDYNICLSLPTSYTPGEKFTDIVTDVALQPNPSYTVSVEDAATLKVQGQS